MNTYDRAQAIFSLIAQCVEHLGGVEGIPEELENAWDGLEVLSTFSTMSQADLVQVVNAMTDLFGDVCVAVKGATGCAALIQRALSEGGYRGWF